MTIAVQFNGKTRGTIDVSTDSSKDEIIQNITKNDNFKKYFVDVEIVKEVYVPKRLVNLVFK